MNELNTQQLRLSMLKRDLAFIKERNLYIERKISGLTGQFIDHDLLEEEVRRVLHYKAKSDLILKTSKILP